MRKITPQGSETRRALLGPAIPTMTSLIHQRYPHQIRCHVRTRLDCIGPPAGWLGVCCKPSPCCVLGLLPRLICCLASPHRTYLPGGEPYTYPYPARTLPIPIPDHFVVVFWPCICADAVLCLRRCLRAVVFGSDTTVALTLMLVPAGCRMPTCLRVWKRCAQDRGD